MSPPMFTDRRDEPPSKLADNGSERAPRQLRTAAATDRFATLARSS